MINQYKESGGFLGPLAGLLTKNVLPMAAKIPPKVAKTISSKSYQQTCINGIERIFRNGMVSVTRSNPKMRTISDKSTK